MQLYLILMNIRLVVISYFYFWFVFFLLSAGHYVRCFQSNRRTRVCITTTPTSGKSLSTYHLRKIEATESRLFRRLTMTNTKRK